MEKTTCYRHYYVTAGNCGGGCAQKLGAKLEDEVTLFPIVLWNAFWWHNNANLRWWNANIGYR